MATKHTKIWFVGFPTFQYNEDVSALAIAANAKIIDAVFDDGTGDELPNLTLKDEYNKAPKIEQLYDIYKVTDGERAGRASKANVTLEDAEEWVSGRDSDYAIVESD